MCNIHIIYPLTRKVNDKDIELMKKLLRTASYRNKDAWGVTNGVNTVGAPEQYDNQEISSDFVNSNFLVGHNRLATQGLTVQPAIFNNYVIAHNGVLSDYTANSNDSDSLLFLKDFVHKKNYVLKKSIIETLKSMMPSINGSYSMFLMHKNSIYYLKNKSTSMTFYLLKDNNNDCLIIGSTLAENIAVAIRTQKYGFNVNKYAVISKKVPEINTIYEITDKGLVKINSYQPIIKSYDWTKQSYPWYPKNAKKDEEGEYDNI